MSLQSPLTRVRGRGSAKQGVSHWWVQRVTAVALVPLTLWFVIKLLGLPSLGFVDVRAWVADGWTPVLLIMLLGAMAWHSALGIQVVLEDYIRLKALKVAALFTSTIFHVLVTLAGSYAVLRIAFTTPITAG
jgi:succinate dehydrogenase / fumarate reductase membrane anchor subunit